MARLQPLLNRSASDRPHTLFTVDGLGAASDKDGYWFLVLSFPPLTLRSLDQSSEIQLSVLKDTQALLTLVDSRRGRASTLLPHPVLSTQLWDYGKLAAPDLGEGTAGHLTTTLMAASPCIPTDPLSHLFPLSPSLKPETPCVLFSGSLTGTCQTLTFVGTSGCPAPDTAPENFFHFS